MARTLRFHLDENSHGAIAPALRRVGIDVTTTPELVMKGKVDDDQLAYAHSTGRVLFTQDRDFLRMHAAGADHSGIAYCDKGSRTVHQIVDGLALIWEVMEHDQIRRTVEFL